MDINILYKDRDIIVCEKPIGVLSEKEGMPKLLGDKMRLCGESDEVLCVHRLDRIVGGLMIFGRHKKAAAVLSEAFSGHDTVKEYLTAVEGTPEEKTGIYKDLIFKDSRANKSYPVKRMRKGVKEAELSYELLETVHDAGKEISLIKVRIKTGRSHQIRVQFSSRKMPIIGDGKYGSRHNGDIALWSYRLSAAHPVTGERLCYSCLPPLTKYPWNLFDTTISEL